MSVIILLPFYFVMMFCVKLYFPVFRWNMFRCVLFCYIILWSVLCFFCCVFSFLVCCAVIFIVLFFFFDTVLWCVLIFPVVLRTLLLCCIIMCSVVLFSVVLLCNVLCCVGLFYVMVCFDVCCFHVLSLSMLCCIIFFLCCIVIFCVNLVGLAFVLLRVFVWYRVTYCYYVLLCSLFLCNVNVPGGFVICVMLFRVVIYETTIKNT